MRRKILINYDLLALILLASETKMLLSRNTVGSTDCGATASQRIFVFSQVASVIFSASYPHHICKFQIAIFWRV